MKNEHHKVQVVAGTLRSCDQKVTSFQEHKIIELAMGHGFHLYEIIGGATLKERQTASKQVASSKATQVAIRAV